MISRRDFLQATVATSAIYGASGVGNWAKLSAQQALTQNQLLDFNSTGNVTLIHITDVHAQLKPIYFREPEINLGVGDATGLPPHVTGQDFLKMFNMTPGTPEAYALTYTDFTSLANDDLAMKRISTELSSVAEDINGDLAGIGNNLLLATANGIRIDRNKIRGSY